MATEVYKVKSRLFLLKVFIAIFSLSIHLSTLASQNEIIQKEAEQNLDYLMSKVIDKTKDLLRKQGEFYPFGAVLLNKGVVKFIWAVPKEKVEGRKLNPTAALSGVRRTLIAQAKGNRILGGATVYNYKNKEGKVVGSQINIELEYLNGYSIIRAIEYNVNVEDKSISFGKAVEQQIEAKIFTKERI